MNTWIEAYLREITHTRAQKTTADYTERLARFSRFISAEQKFDRQAAASFLFSLKNRSFGEASIAAHAATLQSFYTWLESNGIAERLLDLPFGHYYCPTRRDEFAFTQLDYEAMRIYCLSRIRKGSSKFWFGALTVGWNTGLRLRDVAFLPWTAINLTEGKITVEPHKTKRFGKQLEIPILPELSVFFAAQKPASPFVFPDMARSYELSGNSALSTQFTWMCRQCEIHGKSFHSLRHAFVSRLLNSGLPISIVSSMTGQTLKVLQRYSHASFEEKKRMIQRIAA